MSSVWIGFIGVVVGGLISTAWAWLAEIRKELSDAIVAARLVDESLQSLGSAYSGASTDRPTHAEIWAENRVALAKALGRRQWEDVARVYRSTHSSAPPEDPEQPVCAARKALAPLVAGKRHVIRQRWDNMLTRR